MTDVKRDIFKRFERDDPDLAEAVASGVVLSAERLAIDAKAAGLLSKPPPSGKKSDASLGIALEWPDGTRLDTLPAIRIGIAEGIATWQMRQLRPRTFWQRLGDAIIARVSR